MELFAIGSEVMPLLKRLTLVERECRLGTVPGHFQSTARAQADLCRGPVGARNPCSRFQHMQNESSHERGDPVSAVSLRAEQPEDEGLLFEVYASTRQEELDLTGWDKAARAAFLNLQFRAMRQGYRSTFPQAQFAIIQRAGIPVGRLVLNRAEAEIRVVDIALLPAHRNQGLGTKLMRMVLEEALQSGKPVRLRALQNSRAVRFYTRLGFTPLGEPDVYQELEWRPPGG
jgi:GNAT superfamily N-acetyltransferase